MTQTLEHPRPTENTLAEPLTIVDATQIYAEPGQVHHGMRQIGKYGPLLSEAEVTARYGLKLGSLEAQIILPAYPTHFQEAYIAYEKSRSPESKQEMAQYPDIEQMSVPGIEPIYCFKVNTREGKHRAPDADAQPDAAYVLATESLLKALQETAHAPGIGRKDLEDSLVYLHRGEELQIGRDHWLPGIGNNPQLARAEAPKYNAVSAHHGVFSVTEEGMALYTDTSYNGTEVVTRQKPETQRPRRQSFGRRIAKLLKTRR